MKVYVVNLEMSSPYQLDSSERLDEKTRKLHFKFSEDKRKEIHRVNQYHKSKIYINTLDFHGLKICKEEHLTAIISQAQEAHEEMYKTDPSLHAYLAYFSLDMSEVSKGDTYGQVLSAIRYQIVSQILDRLNELTETRKIDQLTEQSKKALLRMVDKLKAINILNDKEVEIKLDEIKESILTDTIGVMKKDLVDEMISIKKGGAYLRFRGEQSPRAHPADIGGNKIPEGLPTL